MEMHQIRYFLAVCEMGNFTRAAELCHVSQPSLTFAIKRLEEEVGGQVFSRERNRVRLTQLGELLRPRLSQIVQESHAALSEAHHFLKLDKTPLKLGVLMTMGPVRLSQFLVHFQRLHTGIEVELHDDTQENLMKKMRGGELDLAILNQLGADPENFQYLPLYKERYMVVFPKGHPFETKKKVKLREVSGNAYVDRLSCEMRDMVMKVCGEMKVDLYATYRSNREDWVQGMVAAGLGFAFLPEFTLYRDEVRARVLAEPEVTRQISLLQPVGDSGTPAAAALVEEIKAWAW